MSYLVQQTPNKLMRSYLDTMGVNCTDDCAEPIRELLPIEWMDACLAFEREPNENVDIGYIEFYTGDGMMALYRRAREDNLTRWDRVKLDLINDVILEAPRPNKSFTVFRGLYGNPLVEQGDIVTHNLPKSGSFSLEDIAIGYIGTEVEPNLYGYLVEIEVPPHLPCFYTESEYQVIFPTGAQFEVLEGEKIMDWFPFGKASKVVGYRWRYLGLSKQ